MNVPLAVPILNYLAGLNAGDDPAAPLFPEIYKLIQKDANAARLSQQFHEILASAGLAKPQCREHTGEGHSRRRTVNPISFHSLRHTATSLLKNAGVSAVVAMDIIGHDSEAISRHYTHIDPDVKRAAIANIPDLTGAAMSVAEGKKKGAKKR